jgi:hypothetical protein
MYKEIGFEYFFWNLGDDLDGHNFDVNQRPAQK